MKWGKNYEKKTDRHLPDYDTVFECLREESGAGYGYFRQAYRNGGGEDSGRGGDGSGKPVTGCGESDGDAQGDRHSDGSVRRGRNVCGSV